MASPSWSCKSCSAMNPYETSECKACKTRLPTSSSLLYIEEFDDASGRRQSSKRKSMDDIVDSDSQGFSKKMKDDEKSASLDSSTWVCQNCFNPNLASQKICCLYCGKKPPSSPPLSNDEATSSLLGSDALTDSVLGLKELDDSKGAGDNQKMVSVRFVLPREHSKRVNESVEKITEENKQVQIEITNNLEDQSYISISALEVFESLSLVEAAALVLIRHCCDRPDSQHLRRLQNGDFRLRMLVAESLQLDNQFFTVWSSVSGGKISVNPLNELYMVEIRGGCYNDVETAFKQVFNQLRKLVFHV